MLPSLVQHVETSAGAPPFRSYRDHLRRNDPDEWDAAEIAYAGSGKMNPAKTLPRLRSCRTDAWFLRNKTTGEVRVSSMTCKLRWCPPCAQAKQIWIQKQVADWILEQQYPKFLTLTLQHTDLPVVDQVRTLYDAFRRFRKMKWFADRCTGGVWFFQLKLSETDDKWHPHLHCIVTGRYLPLRKLSKEWEKASSGSYVVDVQMVKDHQNAANEVARYCSRPVRLAHLSHGHRAEVLDAFHSRRLCGTWGTGRTISLSPKPDYVKEDWHTLGSWTSIHIRLDHDPAARQIVKAWSTGLPLEESVSLLDYIDEAAKQNARPPPEHELDSQRRFFTGAHAWSAA